MNSAGIAWDQFKPTQELSNQAKVLVKEIANVFLDTGTGTPDHDLKVRLGKGRQLLSELVSKQFIRNISNKYYPAFGALYYLPPEQRQRCENALALVMEGFQYLYRRHGARQFGEADLRSVAYDPSRVAGAGAFALRIGMSFVPDFRFYFLSWNPSHDVPVTAATVAEEILDFESVEESWRRECEERKPSPTPVASIPNPEPSCQFLFVADLSLRKIIERDYRELGVVKQASATKSRLMLTGGLIEALLLDALKRAEAEAMAAKAAPKREPLDQWNLASLLNVAVELKVIRPSVERHGHGVRDYRNLIHPGVELRSDTRVSLNEANIAEEVVAMIIDDLANRSRRGGKPA